MKSTVYLRVISALLTTSRRSSPGATSRTSVFCPTRLCRRRKWRPGSSCFTCVHKSPLMFSAPYAQKPSGIFHGPALNPTAAVRPRRELFTGYTLSDEKFEVNRKKLRPRDRGVCASVCASIYAIIVRGHWMNRCVISNPWEHNTTGCAATDASTKIVKKITPDAAEKFLERYLLHT